MPLYKADITYSSVRCSLAVFVLTIFSISVFNNLHRVEPDDIFQCYQSKKLPKPLQFVLFFRTTKNSIPLYLIVSSGFQQILSLFRIIDVPLGGRLNVFHKAIFDEISLYLLFAAFMASIVDDYIFRKKHPKEYFTTVELKDYYASNPTAQKFFKENNNENKVSTKKVVLIILCFTVVAVLFACVAFHFTHKTFVISEKRFLCFGYSEEASYFFDDYKENAWRNDGPVFDDTRIAEQTILIDEKNTLYLYEIKDTKGKDHIYLTVLYFNGEGYAMLEDFTEYTEKSPSSQWKLASDDGVISEKQLNITLSDSRTDDDDIEIILDKTIYLRYQ